MKKYLFLGLFAVMSMVTYAQEQRGYNRYVFAYDDAQEFSEGLAAVKSKGRWGYIDGNGKLIVPLKYLDAQEFSEGFAGVKNSQGWGYINKQGKKVISASFDIVRPFHYGLAAVCNYGRWGLIDTCGKRPVPCKYARLGNFSEGFAFCVLKDKYGFINLQGEEIVPPKYEKVDDFKKGYARVTNNGKIGLVNTLGKETVTCIYDEIELISDQMAWVKRYNKQGYVNILSGREIVPCKYDQLRGFVDGIARAQRNSKYGYINLSGKEIIPCEYDIIEGFVDGIAKAKRNGKYGYINLSGKEIIPCEYDIIGGFVDGIAKAKRNGKYGYVNTLGQEVIPCKYDIIWGFVEDFAEIAMNGKYGFVHISGEEIPCKYQYASAFNGGVAKVGLEDKVYYINKRGALFPTEQDAFNSIFSRFSKDYVETNINAWQQKGEFEKISDWEIRVNEQSRKAKIDEFVKQAELEFIALASSKEIPYELKQYDAENETYLVMCNQETPILVPVPIDEAPSFKEQWDDIVKTPTYCVYDDLATIAEVRFVTPQKKSYVYSNTASLQYTVAELNYNFDPIELPNTPNGQVKPVGQQNFSTTQAAVGKSDVDMNIPVNNASAEKTFAVIIANEDYTNLAPVPHAKNDGQIFRAYCRKTLGLPENNIREYTNATYSNMRYALQDIAKIARVYNGEARVIFYYAGHGAPDDQTKAAYLMPVDAFGVDSETCYSLGKLYAELAALEAQSVTVFLDACFSGATRDSKMLASARGVAIRPKAEAVSGKMVVFSAASADETALPYTEKGHGLFTYFLLKKLQESKGNVTLGELGRYLSENISRQSVVVNQKSQTPTVIASPDLLATWQTLRLR